MKHIKKKRTEPPTLKTYRETTPNATYAGFADTDQKLKKALLSEQGHICAYCMGRISTDLNEDKKPRIEVEHYLSQKERPELDLIYKNMLGVCNGITRQKKEHCDKSKKEKLLKVLDPLNSKVEKLLTYTFDGFVKSISNNEDVNSDLRLLNLNDSFLKDIRKEAMDKTIKRMEYNYPNRQWTKYLFDKEIEFWKEKENGHYYQPYCQVAIWFLGELKQNNRYPAK